MDFFEDMERGQGIYLIAYKNGKPDEIFFAGRRANLAATTPPLRPIERERGALDIAAVRNSDEDVLFDDQIFDREIALGLDDLSAAFVGEFFFDLGQLGGDQLHQFSFVRENRAQMRDRLLDRLVLRLNFIALERSQAAQSCPRWG